MVVASPSVAFRVDSSSSIAGGHIMRCLALAIELRRRGARVRFISRPHAGHLSNRVEQDGFEVSLLAAGSDGDVTDARDTLSTLEGGADWIVADHYAIGHEWETVVRGTGSRLLVIDDLANRPHVADALLDQTFVGPHTLERYDDLVPKACTRLLGPRFALLASDYAELRHTALRSRNRIVVTFGGSDATNETAKALTALTTAESSDRDVDVVLGANHPAPLEIDELAARRPRTQVHRAPSSLASLIAGANTAIGAGGITTWERLCLNVPSVVVTIADNQVPSIKALSEAGYVRWIGSTPTVADYIEGLRGLPDLADKPPLVDGLGAKRVAEFLCPSATSHATLRRATAHDASLFFDWRNDSEARAQSFSQDAIDWPTHRRWFESKLTSQTTELYVGIVNGLPIGQVRLDFEGDQSVLSYSVDAVVRGRGWGGWLVSQAMRAAGPDRCRILRAGVRATNTASCRIFQRLGWTETATPEGHIEYTWTPVAHPVGESR